MSTTQEALRIAKQLHDSIHGDAYLGQPKERELIRELVADLAEPQAKKTEPQYGKAIQAYSHLSRVDLIELLAERDAALRSKQAPTAAECDEDAEAVETLAALLWQTEAIDVGAPPSIAAGRTKAFFDEQDDELKKTWRKFARVALRARAEQREAPSVAAGQTREANT